MTPINITIREILKPSDLGSVTLIVESSGFFSDEEVKIAKELVLENLDMGEEKSGYAFNIAEINNEPVGFTCYGKIPGTIDSFDLYWIAVHQIERAKGIGKVLIAKTFDDIRKKGGKNIWIETSSRPIYEPSRKFYHTVGCEEMAQLPNFYANGDDKLVYLKKI